MSETMQITAEDFHRLQMRAELADRITEKNHEVDVLRKRAAQAKTAAAEKKADYNEAVAELQEMIAEGVSPQLSLPYEEIGGDDVEEDEPSGEGFEWMEYPAESLTQVEGHTFNDPMLISLNKVGCRTVGGVIDLVDGKNPHVKGPGELSGWGPGKITWLKKLVTAIKDDPSIIPEHEETEKPSHVDVSVVLKRSLPVLLTDKGFEGGDKLDGWKMSDESVAVHVIDPDGQQFVLLPEWYEVAEG